VFVKTVTASRITLLLKCGFVFFEGLHPALITIRLGERGFADIRDIIVPLMSVETANTISVHRLGLCDSAVRAIVA
jgi:hypothetical protein